MDCISEIRILFLIDHTDTGSGLIVAETPPHHGPKDCASIQTAGLAVVNEVSDQFRDGLLDRMTAGLFNGK